MGEYVYTIIFIHIYIFIFILYIKKYFASLKALQAV